MLSTPRTLLLGATGQLGTAMRRLLDEYAAPRRNELDLSTLTHDEALDSISGSNSRLVINCAAYTAVDRAEDEPDLATRVNGEAVGILAEVTSGLGIPFVTFSTDYVFDGRGTEPYMETDHTDPINAYGRSKLVGEERALEANPETLVVRTSWVVSGTHPNFVATMLRLAAEGRSLQVVDDQHGCPTIADDLAAGTLEAIGESVTGLLHLTNEGPTTWFGLARAAVSEAGLDEGSIEPCTTAEYPTRAARPAYSVLGSERRESLGLASLPHWRQSLPDMVGQLLSKGT